MRHVSIKAKVIDCIAPICRIYPFANYLDCKQYNLQFLNIPDRWLLCDREIVLARQMEFRFSWRML
jgi:hypothetical protein